MLARELAIVLRARMTWVAAALSALLVGHGFVLAIDLFSAGSRSALANTLMRREFDPLAGIVRPTLGGLYLAVSLLVPLVAARAIAIEKERRAFRPLLLQTAQPGRVVAAKMFAALAGASLQLLAPILLLGVWRIVGGHLAAGETLVALGAHALYLALVVALAVAASAWTETLAQAAVVSILVVAASWAIDASEGFAALVWLGRAVDWSVTTHLYPMERGTLAFGAVLWLLVLTGGAAAIAGAGARFERRIPHVCAAVLVTLALGVCAHRVQRIADATEARRASLPRAAARELAALPGRLRVEVWLDRDDARRRQLESDTLAKLRIARPDLEIVSVLDERAAPAEGEREPGYGRVIVEINGARRETFSTSRKEIVTLIFEAAGGTLPDWSQPEYPGYPLVIEGAKRRVVLAIAYLLIPGLLLLPGYLRRRKRT